MSCISNTTTSQQRDRARDMHNWLFAIKCFYRGTTGYVVLATMLLLGAAACECVSPLMGKMIFDKALPSNAMRLLFVLGAIWLVCLLLTVAFRYFGNLLLIHLDLIGCRNAKTAIVTAFLHEYANHGTTGKQHGDQLSRIFVDPDRFVTRCGLGITAGASAAVITFCVLVAITLRLDSVMASVCLAASVLSVALQSRTLHTVAKAGNRVASVRASVSASIENLLACWRTVIRSGKISQECANAKATFARQAEAALAEAKLRLLIAVVATVPMVVMPILLLWLGAYRISRGTTTIGTLVAFLSYMRLMTSSLQSTVITGLTIVSGLGQAEEVITIIRRNDASVIPGAGTVETSPLSSLTISDLIITAGTFRLTADRLQFAKGQTYLLTGPSGVGKSIFLQVLAGIRRPQRMRATRNGLPLDIEGFMNDARGFGYLAKDDVLFDRTISGNMSYALTVPRSGHVDQWATTVGLVGRESESVQTLSAGEQQRVTLVREVVKDPVIVIIDEGMDSIDADLRMRVLRCMRDQLRDSVFIVCTHEWKDVIPVDGYLSIGNGNVVQHGGEGAE